MRIPNNLLLCCSSSRGLGSGVSVLALATGLAFPALQAEAQNIVIHEVFGENGRGGEANLFQPNRAAQPGANGPDISIVNNRSTVGAPTNTSSVRIEIGRASCRERG